MIITDITGKTIQRKDVACNGSTTIDISTEANIINIINERQGMLDKTVYNSYISKGSSSLSLWSALNNGIAFAEINSPIRVLSKIHGIEGNIYDITKFQDTIYIATNLGVYYLEYDENNYPVFAKVNLDSEESTLDAWSFLKYKISEDKEILLIGTNFALLQIEDKKLKQLNSDSRTDFNIRKLANSSSNSNMIYIGEANNLSKLTYKDNMWYGTEKASILNYQIRSICEDTDKNIWLGTNIDGIIKITPENDTIIYDEKSGLPNIINILIYNIENKLFFATTDGLYKYNKDTDDFSKIIYYSDSCYIGSNTVFLMAEDHKGNIWLSREGNNKIWLEKLYYNKKNVLKKDSTSLKRLNLNSITSIYPDTTGLVWIGTYEGLYVYNDNYEKDYLTEYNALIRMVTLNEDAIIFYGTNYTNVDSKIGKISALKQNKDLTYNIDYKNNSIKFEYSAAFFEATENIEYSYYFEGYSENWTKWSKESRAIFTNLHEGKYNFKVKAKNIYELESTIAEFNFMIHPPWYRTIWAYLSYLIFGIAIIWIIIKLYTRKLVKEKQRLERIVLERTSEIRDKNKVLESQKEEIILQNEELHQQKEEIEAQRDEIKGQRDTVFAQKDKIEKQNEDITSSIQYASRIQTAILPPYEFITDTLSDIFVLFRPRDIVSGDFYWIREKMNKIIIVAADCTGHGVPGAFMSMLGISLLNEIVAKATEIETDLILNQLRKLVIKSLHQNAEIGGSQDGMDLAMIIVNKMNNEIQFSGANNPLILLRNNKEDFSAFENTEEDKKKFKQITDNENLTLVEVRADKMPIGISRRVGTPFTSFKFNAVKGDTLYIFSDGYQDQFGGTKGRKFMIKKLKELFIEINALKLDKQKEILNNNLEEWMHTPVKPIEQLDDIIVIGVKM